MAVSPLLTVFGFLHGRAGTMGPRNIFLLLGFRLHLAVIALLTCAATKRNAILKNRLEIRPPPLPSRREGALVAAILVFVCHIQ